MPLKVKFTMMRGESQMPTKYLIKQIQHTTIPTKFSAFCSRWDVEKTKNALREGNVYHNSAYINADGLDEVFEIGNIHHHLVDRIGKFYSISVGDVIVNTQTKEGYVVMPIGFSELGSVA